ncbi:MAG: DUF2066 domain-containing protein [Alphaproteobacteria bacterium]|nr:MAG: DUF2066 domain-containing protein [Alphaproteobacteria bacterium]
MLTSLFCSHRNDAHNVFVVKGVSIESHQSSGVDAQMDAKRQALRVAFAKLVRRLALGVPPAYLFAYNPDQINTFVESYQVSNELLSHTSYQATFQIVFSKQAILDVFASANTKVLTTAQPPVLVVPILKRGDKVFMWGNTNVWGKFLRTYDAHSPLQPFRLPRGDLFDMSTWPVTVYPTFRQSIGLSFGSQYYATRLVVAELVAQDDGRAGLNLIAYDIATGNILSTQSLNLSAADEVAIEPQASGYLIDFLESIAKFTQGISPVDHQAEEFVLTIHHKGLDDFEKMLDTILRVPGVSNVSSLSVNTSSANLRVSFATSFEDLMRNFEAKGYGLVRVDAHIVLQKREAGTLPHVSGAIQESGFIEERPLDFLA